MARPKFRSDPTSFRLDAQWGDRFAAEAHHRKVSPSALAEQVVENWIRRQPDRSG